MKKTSRILSLILVVAMLMSVSSAFAVMPKNQHKQYKTYTCVGDSIAAGYSVDGTGEATGLVRVPGAYHDLLTNMIDANLNQLGCSAFRTVELRYILTGEYTAFEDDLWPLVWGKYTFARETLDAYLTDMFKASIKGSDLVSINLGSNDIMSYTYITALIELQKDGSIPGMEPVKELLEKSGGLGAALLRTIELADTANKLGNVLSAINEVLQRTLEQFKDNWGASIDAILGEGGLNPDTIIVGVGAYNPAKHIFMDSNSTIDLSLILTPVVNQINQFIKSYESK